MKKLLIIACLFLALNLGAQEVKWLTFEEAIELNRREPRKIMIDVYTDWCSWCKVMDKNTFNQAVIANYLNKTYYQVK